MHDNVSLTVRRDWIAEAYSNNVMYQRRLEEPVEFNFILFNDILRNTDVINLQAQ